MRRSPRILLVSLMFLTMMPIVPVSGVTVATIGGGWVSGTVTDMSGAPISGATVEIKTDGPAWNNEVTEVVTAANGTYTTAAIPEGEYAVRVWCSGYVSEWYDDVFSSSDTTPIFVTEGYTTSGIDFDMEQQGTISGTVTDDKAVPIGDIVVRFYRRTAEGSWSHVDNQWTASDGTYAADRLRPGSYRIKFEDYNNGNYATEYYDDVTLSGDASSLLLSDGGTITDIDATLVTAGVVLGTVTDDSTTDPVSGALVKAYMSDGSGGWEYIAADNTAPDGTFEIRSLPTGSVRLGVTKLGYVDSYYLDAADLDSATDVTVIGGLITSGKDVALTAEGSISGTVVDALVPQAISSGTINLWVPDGSGGWEEYSTSKFSDAYTETDGSYHIGGLEAGDYRVEFAEDYYVGEWYDDAPDVDSGITISLATGEDVTGIDAALIPGGTIGTTVKSPAGDTVENIAVNVYRGDDAWALYDSGTTDDAGFYESATLPYGNYRIQAVDPSEKYVTEYYADSATLDSATNITIASQAETGIEMVLDLAYHEVGVAGASRYSTAIDASMKAFADDSVSTVVIATGENWPDALGGAALAGTVSGPLLLTKPGEISAAVLSEIERVGADNAYILGGEGAVSAAVEAQLDADLPGFVERLNGASRYSTARAVADEVIRLRGSGGFDGEVFISTGSNFPDALGASPLSAAQGIPILLTKWDEMPALPAEVTAATILGGDAVVSPKTEDLLEAALGASEVDRIGGSNRYDTAAQVAAHGVATGMQWDGVGIATGLAFPDALSGGAMLGSQNSVVLLTRPTALVTEARNRLTDNSSVIGTVRFLGGTAAVSQDVRDSVAQILE